MFCFENLYYLLWKKNRLLITTDIRRIRLKSKKIPEVGNLEKARLRKKKSERCHHFRRK
jgi:hypothetical protein